jgi:hypothetical protein
MAQVDLEERVHRNRPIGELSRMAFAVIRAALSRLGEAERRRASAALGMFQFESEDGEYRISSTPIQVDERPAAVTVAGYPAAR